MILNLDMKISDVSAHAADFLREIEAISDIEMLIRCEQMLIAFEMIDFVSQPFVFTHKKAFD